MLKKRKKTRFTGYLDDCDQNKITGWIIEVKKPNRPVIVNVFVDGNFFISTTANIFRQDLLDGGIGEGKHSFEIDVPALLLDGLEHLIEIKEKGNNFVLAGSPKKFLMLQSEYRNLEGTQLTELVDFFSEKISNNSSYSQDIAYSGLGSALDQLNKYSEAMESYAKVSHIPSVAERSSELLAIEGRIERFKNGTIYGWAIRKVQTNKPVELEIHINGVYYQTVVADIYREDLNRVSENYEGGGFKISLAPMQWLSDTEKNEISMVALPYKIPLKKSPIKISELAFSNQNIEVISSNVLSSNTNSEISIIIPVFNAVQEFTCCLESLLEYTTYPVRLIIINDTSTDPKVASLLADFEGSEFIEIVSNESNLGFTRTVNKGIQLAGSADVILLNSDTIVTPRWVENLRCAAYSDEKVATATAVSDNSGAFSVPEIGLNIIPSWFERSEYARMITQVSAGLRPPVPTGNGFCLYIRRDCLDEAGMLDEEAFPRGYGEENDFCMRTLRMGWNHVVDDRTIVYHVRSASFGAEKNELYSSGGKIIKQRYPEYKYLTHIFQSRVDFLAMRYRIRCLNQKNFNRVTGKPRILYVVSTRTGGTPQTNADLMSGVRCEYDTWLLRCNSFSMELSQVNRDSASHVIQSHHLAIPIDGVTHCSNEYDRILARWLEQFAIEFVHIRHIAWHSLGLFNVCKKMSIPMVFSFHDFYTICPTVKLLDGDLNYCGGICTASDTDCKVELWPQNRMPPLKNKWVKRWQLIFETALKKCDAFVTTAPSAYETLVQTFPFLNDADFRVIPHGRSFDSMLDLHSVSHEDRIKILVPGNINDAKGALIISALTLIDHFGILEFHILGNAISPLLNGKQIVKHGTYNRSEFAQKIKAIKPSLGAVFSIWPETYCHTLTELWSVGLPVLAFDFGAVAERIRKTGGGWILPHEDIEKLFAEIVKIALSSQDDYEEKLSQVAKWQKNEGTYNNIEAMTSHYLNLYHNIQTNRRILSKPSETEMIQNSLKTQVAIVTAGDVSNNIAPGSVHVRVLEWIHNSISRKVDYKRCYVSEILTTPQFVAYDAILVQRNSVTPVYMDALINFSKQNNVSIIVEIDDDLLNVPADKDHDGKYASGKSALKKLIQNAQFLIVSTPFLKGEFLKYNPNIIIKENRLSARLWFAPLTKAFNLPNDQSQKNGNEIRIVYMGTNTHAEDLALIRRAMELLKENHPMVRFFVVGGEPITNDSDNHNWYERIDIPKNTKNYPSFSQWFRAIAKTMDFAIAPLADNDFNKSKSGLKFLEYAGGELSGLFSDVSAYQGLVNESGIGNLVSNTEDDWLQALTDAVLNINSWKEQGIAVNNWVETNYTIEKKTNWFDALFSEDRIQ